MKRKLLITACLVLFFVYPVYATTLEVFIHSVEELKTFLDEAPSYPEKELLVYLDEGKYALPVTLPPNTTLAGKGPGKTVLEGVQGEKTALTLSFDNTVRDLSVHLFERGNLYAVYARGQKNILLDNIHIQGNDTYGLYLMNCRNIEVHRSVFHGNDYGIFIKDSQNFLIENSLFLENGFTGLYLDTSEGNILRNLFAYNAGYGIFSSGTFLYYRRLFARSRYNIHENLFFQNGPEGDGHLKNILFHDSNTVLDELAPVESDTGIIPGLQEINEEYDLELPFE